MAEKKTATLCEDDIRDIVSETVKTTLTSLGIEISDPLEMQRDFQFVRDMRAATKSAKAKALLGMVALLVTGLGYLLWEGFKSWFHKGP